MSDDLENRAEQMVSDLEHVAAECNQRVREMNAHILAGQTDPDTRVRLAETLRRFEEIHQQRQQGLLQFAAARLRRIAQSD